MPLIGTGRYLDRWWSFTTFNEPPRTICEIAAEIAMESDLELPKGWLNDAVKMFPFPGDRIDEAARVR